MISDTLNSIDHKIKKSNIVADATRTKCTMFYGLSTEIKS